jgi:hypothetical protein
MFDFYEDLFPTDEMKITVAMLYIHILDLLSRLAKYFGLGSLGDASLRVAGVRTDLLQTNSGMLCFPATSTPFHSIQPTSRILQQT